MLKISSNKYKALLFDNDGVLINSEPQQNIAWTKAYDDLGIEYIDTKDHILLFGGQTVNDSFKMTTGIHDQSEAEKFAKRRQGYFFEEIENNGLPTFPGILELLNSAHKKGLKLAVVTGARVSTMVEAHKKAGIPEIFDTTVNADHITKPKPDPEGYLLAAKKLGVRPEECIVFEDAPNGIRAAKSAGMRCIVVATQIPDEIYKEIDPNLELIRDFTEIEIIAN